MPTVGRVMAQTMQAPLREIINQANRTGEYMKKNGALTELGKERFEMEKVKFNVKSAGQLAQKAVKHIVETIKFLLLLDESSKKPLCAEKICSLEKLKKAIVPFRKITASLPEEMQKIAELTQK